MPPACSRINPVEFLSTLFWTQAKHLPAFQEKQVLERFASEQPEKITTSRMGDTWRGLSSGKPQGREKRRQARQRRRKAPGGQSDGQNHRRANRPSQTAAQRRGHGAGRRARPRTGQDAGKRECGGSTRESHRENNTALNYRQRHKQDKTQLLETSFC